jgi:RNA polymerase sigma-70 factor (ECF subfamily)
MPEIDSQLIQRAQKGDREAIAALYDGCYASVFTFIYYRVSDLECAEDLAIEVFVRMISMLPSYADQGRPFLAWLYTIARNLVIDDFRNRKIKAVRLDERLVGNNGKHPGALWEECESHEYLRRAMEKLTEEQRMVIQLKFIEDYEIGEVAAILGRNERAIRSLQHRALATLSRIFHKEYDYEP